MKINIDKIRVNKDQPRKHFDEESIASLVGSINTYGLLQPIIVQQKDDMYEVVAGERRFRACTLAGLSEVEVNIVTSDRFSNDSIALVENIQREDLSAIEEAQAFRKLIDQYGLTQLEVAKVVGKKPSTISNKLRLLNLSDDVVEALTKGVISERHGRAMINLSEEEQKVFLSRTIEKDYTVSTLEREIAKKASVKKRSYNKKIIVNKDFKLATNTIKQAALMIENTGLNVDLIESYNENEAVFTIKISRENNDDL